MPFPDNLLPDNLLPDNLLPDNLLPDNLLPDEQPDTNHLPRFLLGQLVATPTALSTLVCLHVSPWTLVKSHVQGDWGDLVDHDRQESERGLAAGTRLLSAYILEDGTRIWIITEADRSATTLLLPEEY